MTEERYTIELKFGSIKLDSWIAWKPLPDGSFSLTGMGRKTEYDKDGLFVSTEVKPTGLTGWSPANCGFLKESRFKRFLRYLW